MEQTSRLKIVCFANILAVVCSIADDVAEVGLTEGDGGVFSRMGIGIAFCDSLENNFLTIEPVHQLS